MLGTCIVAYIGLLLTTAGAIGIRLKCISISTEYGMVFLLVTLAIAVASAIFPVKKALKNSQKRYLAFMLIPIILFLVQIILKDLILGLWHNMFDVYTLPASV